MLETDSTKRYVLGLGVVALVVGLSTGVAALISSSSPVADAPAPVAAVRVAPESRVRDFVAPAPVAAVVARPAGSALDTEARASAALRAQERKAFQLELENARLRSRLDDMLNWILDNVRGKFPLPERQMANLRIAPLDLNFTTSAELAEILRLNDEEVFLLDSAFLGTQSVLRELEAENIAVERPSENQAVLNIPPFPEGELVREELYLELRRTLGEGRFDRLVQVSATGLDESFDYFGAADRTLEFEAILDAATGESQLFVRDERVMLNKKDPQRMDITASERIVTEFPDEYIAYWNWLPDSVTRFSRSAR